MQATQTSTNSGTSDGIAVEYVELPLRDLRPAPSNARHMPAAEYRQLVNNLRRDRVLTSAPLVHGSTIISGHHRIRAALEAGIERALCIRIVGDLTDEQRVAIQLAHNRIAGADDPAILQTLYNALSLTWRTYTGFTDDEVGAAFPKLDVASLPGQQVAWQEVRLVFLPDQIALVEEWLGKLGRESRVRIHIGALEAFERFVDAVDLVKRHDRIRNSATALHRLVELAVERLDQLREGESGGEAGG